jgi:hypothetical protein
MGGGINSGKAGTMAAMVWRLLIAGPRRTTKAWFRRGQISGYYIKVPRKNIVGNARYEEFLREIPVCLSTDSSP